MTTRRVPAAVCLSTRAKKENSSILAVTSVVTRACSETKDVRYAKRRRPRVPSTETWRVSGFDFNILINVTSRVFWNNVLKLLLYLQYYFFIFFFIYPCRSTDLIRRYIIKSMEVILWCLALFSIDDRTVFRL